MIKGIRTNDGRLMSFDNFLASNHGYPPSLIRSLIPDTRYVAEPNKYSVGEIIGCLRRSYFERTDGSYQTIEQLFRSATGRSIHYTILKGYDMKERQLSLDFVNNGEHLYIMCKFDGYDLSDKTLTEVKTVDDVTRITKVRYKDALQIQCYWTLARELLRTMPVEKLQVIYADLHRITHYCARMEDKLEFMKNRTTILHKALKARKPPNEEPNPSCEYCLYRKKCDLSNYAMTKTQLPERANYRQLDL